MVTVERIEEVFGDEDRVPFQNRDVDHNTVAIALLRERLPYDDCKSIINSAGHDIIYFMTPEKAAPYLSEEDLAVLSDCNLMISDGHIAMFV